MTSPVTSPDPHSQKLEYASQLLAETREEVARADAKASLLFGAFGVVTSAAAALLVADEWSPFQLSNCVEWLWWVGAALALVALLLLGWAVLPRIRHVDHYERLYYFGHVAEYKTFEQFTTAFDTAASGSWERTLDQVWVASRIAKRKYVLTRWSMLTFLAAGFALAVAVMSDLFFR